MADFTPQQRAEYFEGRVAYWTRKAERFIAPAKVKRAKARIKHYTAKLAEAQTALIEDAKKS